MEQSISHHLVQMLLLRLVEIRSDDGVAWVDQMSKILGFESNHESVLAIHPVVGFTKRLEVLCARLDQLVPFRNTFVLGQSESPRDNLFGRIALIVAEILELSCNAVKDVDTSALRITV